ncbi:MAG TPA: hypothetical protein VFZ24_02435 [Longimicrobiales bacterium]
MSTSALRRTALLLPLSLAAAGCELIGDIFQAGFVVGIIIVVLVIAAIAWLFGKFRRSPR